VNELIPFFIKHWPLTAAFIALALTILVIEFRRRSGGAKALAPAEVTRLINRDNAVIVDVRDEDAFKTGHIVNAINMTKEALTDPQRAFKKYRKRPIVLVDANGQQVNNIAQQLNALELQICTLAGGIAAWRQEGLPLKTLEQGK